jgi:hypothetical protein
LPIHLGRGSTPPAYPARPPSSGGPPSARSSQHSIRSSESEGLTNFRARLPEDSREQMQESARESQKLRRERRRE